MSNKRDLYLVPKTLDAPARVLGLSLDEFIPALLLGGFFCLLGKLILAMIVSAVVVVLVKGLKRGQGSSWLLNLCYWYFPHCLMQGILRSTPPSQQRDYLA